MFLNQNHTERKKLHINKMFDVFAENRYEPCVMLQCITGNKLLRVKWINTNQNSVLIKNKSERCSMCMEWFFLFDACDRSLRRWM